MVRKLKYREIKCLIQDYPAGKPQDLKVDCLGLAGKSKTKKKKKKTKQLWGMARVDTWDAPGVTVLFRKFLAIAPGLGLSSDGREPVRLFHGSWWDPVTDRLGGNSEYD